jgi:hypothetical protein
MTKIKKYIKDSEDTVGGDFTNRPVRKDIIDMIKRNTTKTPSPSGHPHFDEDKVLKYMTKD